MAKYQGWANWETWVINLWLSNDKDTYDHWTACASEAWDGAVVEDPKIRNRSQSARYDMAAMLKDAVEDNNPLAEDADMWSDLLTGCLTEVDWDEIADSWLQEIDDYDRRE